MVHGNNERIVMKGMKKRDRKKYRKKAKKR